MTSHGTIVSLRAMTCHRLLIALLLGLGLSLPATAPAFAQATPAEESPLPPTPAPTPAPPRPAVTTPGAAPTAPRANAAPAATTPAVTPSEADRLIQLLQDDRRRAEFLRTLEALAAAERQRTGALPAAPAVATPAPAAPAPAAAAEPAPVDLLPANTLGGQILTTASQRLSALSEQIVRGVQALTDLPSMLRWMSALARDPVTQFRVLDAGWKLALIFGLGLLAEWLTHRLLRHPRERLDAMAPANGGQWSWFRRVPLVVARLGLDLIPVAAFAVVSYGLIGAVNPLPTTQLVILTVNNAYMVSRAVMASSRMLLSPASAQLRLLPVADETAAYITIWLRRITLVLVAGYAAAEAGLLFGLPWSAYDAITRICLLVVTLLAVIVILQNRAAVAEVLRAPDLPEGVDPGPSRRLARGLRDRLAEVWHLVAILWLFAAWGVWALEVRDGFYRLARVSAATVLIGFAAKFLDVGARRAIQRGFRVGPELAQRYPGLEARANRYVPALKGGVSACITIVAALVLLEAWGLDAFGWFKQGQLGNKLLGSLLSIGFTIFLSVLVWEVVNAAIARYLVRLARDAQASRSARVRTLLPMLRTALMVLILVFLALNTLSEIGVNVAPLLAGAGVIGLAIGFGSQKLVQDVITGIFLLFEDAVAVGDVVQLGGLSGVVEQLSIRSIKLRALDGSVHIVPFSAVTTVTNQTRDFGFSVHDISIAYGQDMEKVTTLLKGVVTEMRGETRWRTAIRDDLDVMGVEKFTDSALILRVRIKTDPTQRWPVQREFNNRVQHVFATEGIAMLSPPLAALTPAAPEPAVSPAPEGQPSPQPR
ncbi:mechanosensitive ion channel domain-containing protein [Plastoroseomonas arctica]|uniref:mechanosensitive ion channel domain-containing protein n=1 Tax=Plastoroseomonas arctica TaxID=1509237 RepID=UPI001FEA2E8F|nr:mechanosensitive ion channel domain-containing protein [Plastoroseomonas arctica]